MSNMVPSGQTSGQRMEDMWALAWENNFEWLEAESQHLKYSESAGSKDKAQRSSTNRSARSKTHVPGGVHQPPRHRSTKAGIRQPSSISNTLTREQLPSNIGQFSGYRPVPQDTNNVSPNSTFFFTPPEHAFLYQYHPVRRELSQFRLLYLEPGSGDNAIQCRMIEPVALAAGSHPEYQALSYRVGGVAQTCSIKLNDSDFEISESLFRALYSVRLPFQGITLWIDQICINQKDVEEKGWQVMQMSHIYACATQTILYLDIMAPQLITEGLKDFLASMYAKFCESWQRRNQFIHLEASTQGNFGTGPYQTPGTIQVNSLYETASAHRFQLSDQNVQQYLELLSFAWHSPIWERCWVYQEIAVSPDIVLVLGETRLPWDVFTWGCRILTAALQMQADNDSASSTPSSISTDRRDPLQLGSRALVAFDFLRDQVRKINKLDLRSLMFIWRTLRATDPRDHIFSALQLAKDSYSIFPNYADSNQIWLLLVNAAKQVIKTDRKLNIVLDACEPERHVEWRLPSWVPDFTVKNSGRTVKNPLPTPARDAYMAMADTVCDISFPPNNCLRMKAVRKWAPFSPDENELGQVVPPGYDASEAWRVLLLKTESYITSRNTVWDATAPTFYPASETESFTDAFSTTLRFGHVSSNSPSRELAERDADMRYFEATHTGDWRFFCNSRGYMGLVPVATSPNDQLCFALGADMPFVIRPHEQFREGYSLIGQAYVHGYMYGLMKEELDQGEVSLEYIDVY